MLLTGVGEDLILVTVVDTLVLIFSSTQAVYIVDLSLASIRDGSGE